MRWGLKGPTLFFQENTVLAAIVSVFWLFSVGVLVWLSDHCCFIVFLARSCFQLKKTLPKCFSWWAFRPRKKIFSPPPPPHRHSPLAPFPLPRILLGTPPFPIFLIKNRPPRPPPRILPLPPPRNRKKSKISETSTKFCACYVSLHVPSK